MARRGDLAGLAALGALGYMLSRGSKAAPAMGGSSMPAATAAAAEAGPVITDDMRQRAIDEGNKVSEGERVSRYKPNVFDVEDARAAPAARPSGRPTVSTASTAPSVRTGVNPRDSEAGVSRSTRASTPMGGSGTGNQRGPTAAELEAYAVSRNVGAGRGGQGGARAGEAAAYQQRQYEAAQAAAATPEGKAARQRQAESQAVEGVYPEQMIGGPGLKTAHAIAKSLAARTAAKEAPAAATFLKELPYSGTKQLPNAPTKQITGPSKGELVARDRAARASGRNEEMLRENARRYGLDPDNISAAEAANIRNTLGGSDFTLGMKKGGKVKVKPKKMASGGMTGSASKRADGIATKGKTRGKMY